MRFTADDAFEAKESGDPIMLDEVDTARLLRRHDASLAEMQEDLGKASCYDAADVLGWLGY